MLKKTNIDTLQNIVTAGQALLDANTAKTVDVEFLETTLYNMGADIAELCNHYSVTLAEDGF